MSIRADNCFDEVRFALAFIVLVSHTSALATADSLNWFTQYFDADFAVKGFFAISGYLVTKSYLSSSTFTHYFEKRVRRIYPAYILAIIYTIFVGFLTTSLSLSKFLSDPEFFIYLISNLAFLNFVQPNLPGSLEFAQLQVLNGSLWTIKVELMLYCMIPFLVYLQKRVGIAITLAISFCLGFTWYLYFYHYFDQPIGLTISRQFPGQLPFFALGSMLNFIKFNKSSIVTLIIFCFIYFVLVKGHIQNPFKEFLNMCLYPILVILIGKSHIISLNLGKYGDFSYGVYLFHFPTIQMLEHFEFYTLNSYFTFVFSILLVMLLSAFSWHFVEKRFLKRSL